MRVFRRSGLNWEPKLQLRTYQQRTIDCLYNWWCAHPGINETPLLVLPTGAGKSHVIAELVRLLFDTWPESQPRTVVLDTTLPAWGARCRMRT